MYIFGKLQKIVGKDYFKSEWEEKWGKRFGFANTPQVNWAAD